MLFSIHFIETFPLQVINIFFFLIFFSVLLISYPVGRFFLNNYCENSFIKCSLFSLVIFSAAVSIIVNLTPVFAKYLIYIFFIINLYILVSNLRIRDDLVKAIVSFKLILIFTFFFIFGDKRNF